MSKRNFLLGEVFFLNFFLLCVVIFLLVPQVTKAVQGVVDSANKDCANWDANTCGCKMTLVQNKCVQTGNTNLCPPGICTVTVAGIKIDGICVQKMVCLGVKAADVGKLKLETGKTEQAAVDAKAAEAAKAAQMQKAAMMQQMGGMLQQAGGKIGEMLEKLMGGGGGGGKGGGGDQNSQSCAGGQYQVSTPSTDPCAVYTPGASGLLNPQLGLQGNGGQNVSDSLLGALSGNGSSEDGSGGDETPVSEQLLSGAEEDVPSDYSEDPNAEKEESLLEKVVRLGGGLFGRIEERGDGSTAVASERDEDDGSEVAGFYGQGGLASRLCKARPWSGSLVSYVIPSGFFDGLCRDRGFEIPEEVTVDETDLEHYSEDPSLLQTTPKKVGKKTSGVRPQASIWAVPERVQVGARTLIFWNTKNAEECEITSSGGSFYETELSGGASTVPLSGPTVFTISCTTGDEVAEDSVIVEMAI
ncbi:MAG TPA: hypothetical protein VJH33_03240 [Candidatus Paceibacterota bacterium]